MHISRALSFPQDTLPSGGVMEKTGTKQGTAELKTHGTEGRGFFFPLVRALFMMSLLAGAQPRGGFGSRAIETARTNFSIATQLKTMEPN